jgi:hypothetical protein
MRFHKNKYNQYTASKQSYVDVLPCTEQGQKGIGYLKNTLENCGNKKPPDYWWRFSAFTEPDILMEQPG